MALSRHAHKRAQQRAIPPLIIRWLREYGASTRAGDRAEVRYFDKSARRRLEHDVGHEVVNRLGALLDTFLIEREGIVITVARRFKRIKRSRSGATQQ